MPDLPDRPDAVLPPTLGGLLHPDTPAALPLYYAHARLVPPSSAKAVKLVPSPLYRADEYACFDDAKPVSKCFRPIT